MQKKKKRTLKKLKLPKVRPSKRRKNDKTPKEFQGFPLNHYSSSSLTQFTANPVMFKINAINGDEIETTTSASGVLGKAVHHGLKYYHGGGEDEPLLVGEEAEAIKIGHDKGFEYLKSYSDGFIKWSATIKNRSDLEKKYAFVYFGFIKSFDYEAECKEVVMVEQMLKHRIEVDGKVLPVPMKGKPDLVYRNREDRLCIYDPKFVVRYPAEDSIEGIKLIQAAFYYFLVYAELGEAPYKMTFGEFKVTENQDKSPQLKEIEIVFEEHPLIFQFFYRLYGDVTDALLGKQVYVPNLYAMWDKEVAILSYIHRLDVNEEREKAFKGMGVDNITDFLKMKIAKEGAMQQFMDTVAQRFVSTKTLNYKDMTTEERIKMKLAEHGIAVDFDSKVVGSAVTLYRFEPSVGLKMSRVEAYVRDIEQVVETAGIRVLAPIPDSGLVGFEVPNKDRVFPTEKPTIDGFKIALGIDILGNVEHMDLREAPHMLIAGSTGSGKSVMMSSIITQLQALGSGTAQLILLDPKMVEFCEFENGANTREYHSDIMDIHECLESLVSEMNLRYKKLKERGAKNLEEYRGKGGRLPFLFVFIDEYGDLVMSKHIDVKTVITGVYASGPQKGEDKIKTVKTDISAEIRKNILLLSQKARAAGIHVILTTQRPSVNVVDGAVKANFPTRIAFKTSTSTDSNVILDQVGAEKLLGKGDCLLLDTSRAGLTRLQGFKI